MKKILLNLLIGAFAVLLIPLSSLAAGTLVCTPLSQTANHSITCNYTGADASTGTIYLYHNDGLNPDGELIGNCALSSYSCVFTIACSGYKGRSLNLNMQDTPDGGNTVDYSTPTVGVTCGKGAVLGSSDVNNQAVATITGASAALISNILIALTVGGGILLTVMGVYFLFKHFKRIV